jgi:hypothetical protein
VRGLHLALGRCGWVVGTWARFDCVGAPHGRGRGGCGGGDGSDKRGPRVSEGTCGRAGHSADGAVPLGRK